MVRLLLAALCLASACAPRADELPRLSEIAPTIDLGDLPSRSATSASLLVANEGAGTLSLHASVDDPDGAFELVAAPLSLDAGESGEVVVEFYGDEPGDYASELRLRSNDPDRDAVYVDLFASVVSP